MISLVNELPSFEKTNAELIKIKCLYDCYKNDTHVLFWVQDNEKAVISLTDGNMIICNFCAETEELKEFVNVISPACVFSDYDTLCSIGRKPKEKINVMSRKADIEGEAVGDTLSSDMLYSLLDTDGLSLPEYPYFAVDYCRRLNMGGADYFALRDKCAVISFKSGENAIINGIASHEKGYGSIALNNILKKNYGKTLYVCCRDKVKGFYEKNGFDLLYFAGYWVKEYECN